MLSIELLELVTIIGLAAAHELILERTTSNLVWSALSRLREWGGPVQLSMAAAAT